MCTVKHAESRRKRCGSTSDADVQVRGSPVQRGSTFALLSGCGAPSSFPSALRGRGSLDSPGDIISARPIDANRKQEREFRIIRVNPQVTA